MDMALEGGQMMLMFMGGGVIGLVVGVLICTRRHEQEIEKWIKKMDRLQKLDKGCCK